TVGAAAGGGVSAAHAETSAVAVKTASARARCRAAAVLLTFHIPAGIALRSWMSFERSRRCLALLACLAAAACSPRTVTTTPESAAPADWADRTLAGMTLREKAAQLLMPRIGGEYVAVGAGAYDRMSYWVRELGVGGVIVTVGPPLEMAVKLNMLQE